MKFRGLGEKSSTITIHYYDEGGVGEAGTHEKSTAKTENVDFSGEAPFPWKEENMSREAILFTFAC